MFPSSFSDDNELEMSMHENRSPTSPPHLESTLAPNAELIASALRMLGIIPK